MPPGIHSKLYPGFRAAPLLPAFPDRRALFPGRLESNAQTYRESWFAGSVCLALIARRTATRGTGKPRRFNATRFAVDPVYGELLDKTAGRSCVGFEPVTFQLDPMAWCATLGLVRCGLQRHAGKLHARTSVQSCAPHWFCLGPEGAMAKPQFAAATAFSLSTARATKPTPVRSKRARRSCSA